MEDAETASYFQHILPTMSEVKGSGAGGHGRPVWVAGCKDDLLYDSRIGIFFLSLSLLSLTVTLSGFLISYGFFFTCMPHYILKVNPINTEITWEDKLL